MKSTISHPWHHYAEHNCSRLEEPQLQPLQAIEVFGEASALDARRLSLWRMEQPCESGVGA